jgi:hypothetical protein
MTIWAADDFDSISDLDAFLDAVMPEGLTNAQLRQMGLYRGVAEAHAFRHYGMLTEAERDKLRLADPDVQRRQKRNRRVETMQGCVAQVWNIHVVLFVVAGVALWLALWWALG